MTLISLVALNLDEPRSQVGNSNAYSISQSIVEHASCSIFCDEDEDGDDDYDNGIDDYDIDDNGNDDDHHHHHHCNYHHHHQYSHGL